MGLKQVTKNILKKTLSEKSYQKLKNYFSYDNPIVRNISAAMYADDLNKLATIYKTDKWNLHWYTQHYFEHFSHLQNEKINLLEIGVGGDDNPEKGGNSVRMWKAYFSKANIYALDLYDKSQHEEKRIKIFRGDQSDVSFLTDVANKIGTIDIIIDDGSHINEHVLVTFKTLFPLLKKGGIYVVEDTQTSYWPSHGGDSKDFNNPNTMLTFFKSLTDSLNYKEFKIADYKPSYYNLNITSIHFYHNLVFIYK
jgi:hypothetical protein